MAQPPSEKQGGALLAFLFFVAISGGVYFWLTSYPKTPTASPAAQAEWDAATATIARLRAAGELFKSEGLATEVSISGWNQKLDITVASLQPEDARSVAMTLCAALHGKVPPGWSVRAYLPVGDRPAATCNI